MKRIRSDRCGASRLTGKLELGPMGQRSIAFLLFDIEAPSNFILMLPGRISQGLRMAADMYW